MKYSLRHVLRPYLIRFTRAIRQVRAIPDWINTKLEQFVCAFLLLFTLDQVQVIFSYREHRKVVQKSFS